MNYAVVCPGQVYEYTGAAMPAGILERFRCYVVHSVDAPGRNVHLAGVPGFFDMALFQDASLGAWRLLSNPVWNGENKEDGMSTEARREWDVELSELQIADNVPLSAIRTEASAIAAALGKYDAVLDGETILLTPKGKLVGGFTLDSITLAELFRNEIQAGNREATRYAARKGLLLGGKFEVVDL